MSLNEWFVFVAIWTLAGLPLGPNALNCIALSAGSGFKRSLWAVLGILIAALCHKAAVILGLATILLANAGLFQVLKLCGAAYLIWMGLTLWRRGDRLPTAGAPRNAARFPIVRQAFLISMSNPKAIFAYIAVFSQFISPDHPLTAQLVILVPTALAVTAAVYIAYCAVGTGVGRFLSTTRRRLAFNRGIGTFYIVAGAALAASGKRP